MSSTPTLPQDSPPESWYGVAAGLVIFIIAGSILIIFELPHGFQLPVQVQTLTMLGLWCFILAPAAGFTMGWIRAFPRWSYPYIPVAGLLPLYFSNVSTPGLTFLGYPTFGREIWGWRALIPLLLGSAIALLVRRSFKPWKLFFSQMKQDWTLGTYALSGTLPLVIFIAYDEIDRLYSLRDMILLSILMVTMAVVYLRARNAHRRRLSLVVSILAILGYTTVSTTVYWRSLGPENVFIPGMIGWVLILVLFYFSPAIPSVWKRIVYKRASVS